MTGEARQRLVIEKGRLLSEFRRLRRALEAYRELLVSTDGDNWPQGTVAPMREQQLALQERRVSPGSAELAVTLLQRVLRRVKVDQFRFEPRVEMAADAHVGMAGGQGRGSSTTDLIVSLQATLEPAPLELQEKLHRVLTNILDLFSALGADDRSGTEGAISRLNLATSNPESRSLLREIAIVTRDIYNALQSVSEELPLDALSHSSSGLSEAVQRLNSVVVRLDEAAMQNLDGLERANEIVAEEQRELAGVVTALRDAQRRMMDLKAEHPELDGPLTAIQDRLADGAGGPAMTLAYFSQRDVTHHMELISNQSFQELTTRTLRKIIEFVESLEMQLFELLKQYSPGGAGAASDEKPRSEPVPGPDAPEGLRTQSQDDVDKLLGELGF